MILAIDIGNTSTKVALVDGHGVVDHRNRIVGSDRRRLRAGLRRILRKGTPAGVVISSVVPSLTRHYRDAARDLTGHSPLVVSTKLRLPIAVGVRQPSRLGMDRLCAACGAVRGRRRHAIVVDAGSAVTVDIVRNRRLLGGAILPGPGVSFAALHTHTGRLPLLDGRGELRPRAIADTTGAMVVGVGLGTAGAIQEIVRWLKRRHRVRPEVFVTGGWADDLLPLLPAGWRRAPDLVFEGMRQIALRNKI